MHRFQATFHLQKCLAIKVNITSMSHVLFPSHFALVQEVILVIVRKTMDMHVLLNLAFAIIMATSFDLQMSNGGVGTFAFVINYLNELWTPMHVTICLFEVHDTTWISMVRQLQTLLEKFDLNASCGCLCERWRQQLDIYKNITTFYCSLLAFETPMGL